LENIWSCSKEMQFGADLNNAFMLFEDSNSMRPVPEAANAPQPVVVATRQGQEGGRQLSTPISALPKQETFVTETQPVQKQPQQQHTSPTYTEKMGYKRRDMLKVVTYALMILLALSLYSVIEMVIKETVVSYDLGYKQEVGLRGVYPLLLLFLLWNIKCFM